MDVSRPKDRANKLLVAFVGRAEHQEGKEAVRAVIPVVELELLLAVGRIIGRVHVDQDLVRRAVRMGAYEELNHLKAQAVQIPMIHRVLETRERRLGCRALVEGQIVKRVQGQGVEIVAVFPAKADSENTLP